MDNVVEGLILAATKGKPGNAYFVTDGDPVVFRDFITELLATAGVEMPDRERADGGREAAGRAHGDDLGRPAPEVARRHSPASPSGSRRSECTIDISKARAELGYEPVKGIEEGLAELRAA